ncbi:MAG: spermidine synthase [Gammaproteobacteria bacterium]|nr:MAG: spermidine synthase [Gammaproteobacteria bacterium]TND05474.1 MAG: spermidine synthase [Gammaproteobacteria bacterium]
MALGDDWYTEIYPQDGAAFSLKLTDKIHEEQTPFQTIAIFETEGFGTLMTIDGLVMLTDRDNFIYHEMMAHTVLFTHAHPQDVVIIGGGDCGTLREVLKHASVRHACQVDIDERVTRLAEQYFPELCDSNHDKRATLMFDDGIRYMADAKPGSVDIVIVDSTDPVGPAEGLFTEKFYRNCHRALRDGGIIVQQSESPLFHLKLIRAMRDAMQAAGFADLATVNFPQCSYPSGWWSATMAGKNIKLNNFRNDAARKRSFATRYYSDGVHGAALNLPPFMITALG